MLKNYEKLVEVKFDKDGNRIGTYFNNQRIISKSRILAPFYGNFKNDKAIEKGNKMHGAFYGATLGIEINEWVPKANQILKREKIEIIESEYFIFNSKTLRGGIVDLIGKRENQIVVIDFKSSKTNLKLNRFDLWFYNELLRQEFRNQFIKLEIWVVDFEKDTYEVIPINLTTKEKKAFKGYLDFFEMVK